jgi:hypothetical protein
MRFPWPSRPVRERTVRLLRPTNFDCARLLTSIDSLVMKQKVTSPFFKAKTERLGSLLGQLFGSGDL